MTSQKAEKASSSSRSPLASVGPLLRFYSWIGAFPARMSENYSVFKINWVTDVVTLLVIGLYIGEGFLVTALAEDTGGEEAGNEFGLSSFLGEVPSEEVLKVASLKV